MIKLGGTARHVRDKLRLTQNQVAEALGITVVHLSHIENDKASPSRSLVDRYRELWNVDLYILSWCMNGNVESLPEAVREPAARLAEAWTQELGDFAKRLE